MILLLRYFLKVIKYLIQGFPSLKRNENLTEGLSPGVISDSHRRSWPGNFYGPQT